MATNLMERKHPSYFTSPGRMHCANALPSSFEEIVQQLGLSPEQYETSDALKAWVRRNKSLRYVPLDLLKAFGFKPGTEV